ncbi:MAG: transcriptional repressor LexA [bacterium]|nr:transcriptional repressor LexA [bacterium]MDW8163860.1 transcriptional repressor LexA [Candidatus Omnitrophota bacterium]
MKKLTEKQKKVFEFIKDYIAENRYPPTIKEIMEHFSFFSPTAVVSYLNALEKKGYIKRDKGKARGIILKEYFLNIPVIGRIPAGTPKIEEENFEEFISVSKEIFGEGDIFSLIVKGDSMKDAGIFDGDYIIVKKDVEIKNGDIVVIFYNGEYTVKYFYKRKNFIELKPANPSYNSIIIKESPLITGKVIGLLRKIK